MGGAIAADIGRASARGIVAGVMRAAESWPEDSAASAISAPLTHIREPAVVHGSLPRRLPAITHAMAGVSLLIVQTFS